MYIKTIFRIQIKNACIVKTKTKSRFKGKIKTGHIKEANSSGSIQMLYVKLKKKLYCKVNMRND